MRDRVSYEDEQRRRDETRDRALEMFKAAVALLPGAWTWTVKDDRDCFVEARRDDGLAIYLTCNAYDRKCWCRPALPANPGGSCYSLRDYGLVPYGEKGPEAGFSPDRKPEAVAREIARKVVEPYGPMFAKLRQRFADERDRRRECAETAAAFAGTLGVEVRRMDQGSGRATVYCRSCGIDADLEVYGAAEVKAEMRLYGDQVEAFRRFLAGLRAGRQEAEAERAA